MSQGNWSDGPPEGGGNPGAPPGRGVYDPPGDPSGYGPPGGYGPSGGGGYGPMTPQMRYADVPWFRKNGINSAFVIAGFFCLPPLLWTTCIIVITGPVYMDAYDERGQLKTWGPANKVVAVILIVFQVVAIAVRLAR